VGSGQQDHRACCMPAPTPAKAARYCRRFMSMFSTVMESGRALNAGRAVRSVGSSGGSRAAHAHAAARRPHALLPPTRLCPGVIGTPHLWPLLRGFAVDAGASAESSSVAQHHRSMGRLPRQQGRGGGRGAPAPPAAALERAAPSWQPVSNVAAPPSEVCASPLLHHTGTSSTATPCTDPHPALMCRLV
jgi:hypothetical protein